MRLTTQVFAFALGAGFLLASPSTARADEVDLPALLKRLAAHAAVTDRNDETVDMVCTERQEELDSDGKVTHWFETLTRVTHPGGRKAREIQKATKDGQDVTAEARARASKKKGDEKSIAVETSNPFAAAEQPKYRFTIKGPAPNDPSKLLLQFGPKGKASTDVMVGHGLVDPAKGEALKFTFRPSEYPSMVKTASLEMDITPASFGPITSRLSFQGEGGILFIKKRVRGSMRCHDFSPPPGTSPPAP
jgi:hypothetical protein